MERAMLQAMGVVSILIFIGCLLSTLAWVAVWEGEDRTKIIQLVSIIIVAFVSLSIAFYISNLGVWG